MRFHGRVAHAAGLRYCAGVDGAAHQPAGALMVVLPMAHAHAAGLRSYGGVVGGVALFRKFKTYSYRINSNLTLKIQPILQNAPIMCKYIDIAYINVQILI